jgi:hypothetical protein
MRAAQAQHIPADLASGLIGDRELQRQLYRSQFESHPRVVARIDRSQQLSPEGLDG